jgi:antitoxin HicB
MRKEKNPHLGSTFDSFLHEMGIYEEVRAAAIKKILDARQKHEMEKE